MALHDENGRDDAGRASAARSEEESQPLGRATFVAMMQAAHLGYGDDPSSIWRLNGPKFRRVFLQSQVRSGPMVIVDERAYVPLLAGLPTLPSDVP
ncbi:MAG: hypothetical protein ABSH09_31755 [Bryobacteraceae bacterium]